MKNDKLLGVYDVGTTLLSFWDVELSQGGNRHF